MNTLAKWSLNDYHKMVAAGILDNRQVELLAGEIVEMAPQTPRRYNAAKRAVDYLATLLQGKADIRLRGSVSLGDSELEPDIAVVALPATAYDERHPNGEDIYWVIDVVTADIQIDRLKASVYARAEVPEYWLLDRVNHQVKVLRDPVDGNYQAELVYQSGSLTSLAFLDVIVSVEQLLD